VEIAELHADGLAKDGDLVDACVCAENALNSISRPIRKSKRPERQRLAVMFAAALARLPTWNLKEQFNLSLVVDFIIATGQDANRLNS
jgi:hypothetical protein